MTITATVDTSKFESDLAEKMNHAKVFTLEAMRDRLYEIVIGNFGAFPVDRPDWETNYLSMQYAKRVGRNVATMVESGSMRDAVMKGGTGGNSTSVSLSNSSVPYATVHHFGNGNMPRRPVFPIEEDGTIRSFTQMSVINAANQAFAEAMQ